MRSDFLKNQPIGYLGFRVGLQASHALAVMVTKPAITAPMNLSTNVFSSSIDDQKLADDYSFATTPSASLCISSLSW
jgi:hypothetical protein